MPTPVLKVWAKEAGISIGEAEKCWNEAKEKANKKFGDEKKDSNAYWAYVNTVARICIDHKKHEKQRADREKEQEKDRAKKAKLATKKKKK